MSGTLNSDFWSLVVLAVVSDVPLLALLRGRGPGTRTSLSACFTLAIFLQFGLAPAIIVQLVAGAATALGQRIPLASGAYLCARLGCALAAAGWVASAFPGYGLPLTAGRPLAGFETLAIVLTAATWFVVSGALVLLERVALYGRHAPATEAPIRYELIGTTVVLLLISPLMVSAVGWWTILMAAPLLAWNQFWHFSGGVQFRRDPTTGVLDQQGIAAQFEELILRDPGDPRRPRSVAIVLINVQSIFEVNRTLGRDIYEQLAAEAARRIMAAYRTEPVGRLTGEGFVVALPGLTAAEAEEEANRAVRVVEGTVEIDSIPFDLDPAAGVALFPRDGVDFNSVVGKALIAENEARRLGERTRPYRRESHEVVQHRVEVLAELHAALRDPARADEITVRYQPQVDLGTWQLVGVEALVRWNHPHWGTVGTAELIAAVEFSEVMHLLTKRVIEIVIAQLSRWNRAGLRLRAAVNVSVNDMHHEQFADEVLATLEANGVAPSQLTIEITEGMLIRDPSRVSRAANAIAALGIGLSLDDFGTGYASLQQLRQLPLTEVKIDQSYIADLPRDSRQQAIVQRIFSLVRVLNMDVVVEGIADAPTAAILRQMPGIVGQGWHLGRPMTAAELDRWLIERELIEREKAPP